MSTLGSMIRLDKSTREKLMVFKPYSVHESWKREILEVSRYKLKAEFATVIVVDDADIKTSAYSDAVIRAKEHIIEGVYGEYRAPLLKAVRLIDNYEPEKARGVILKVLQNMQDYNPMEQE